MFNVIVVLMVLISPEKMEKEINSLIIIHLGEKKKKKKKKV